MTQEEWINLSCDEVALMPNEIFLKNLIRFTEERYIWYKKQIEYIYKNKHEMEPCFFEWYNRMLKDLKNSEEKTLKNLQIETTNEKQGFNPPYCYPY